MIANSLIQLGKKFLRLSSRLQKYAGSSPVVVHRVVQTASEPFHLNPSAAFVEELRQLEAALSP